MYGMRGIQTGEKIKIQSIDKVCLPETGKRPDVQTRIFHN